MTKLWSLINEDISAETEDRGSQQTELSGQIGSEGSKDGVPEEALLTKDTYENDLETDADEAQTDDKLEQNLGTGYNI